MLPDRLHSPIVRAARVVLPVAALALLSTLFLLARSIDPEDAIPFAEVDVSERARDQQLTAPRFAGRTRDGTAYVLLADAARPDAADPRRMQADGPRLMLDGGARGGAVVVAGAADVDTGTRMLRLADGVRIETTTGFALRTPRLDAMLETLEVVAPDGVAGTGPLGELRAGSLRLAEDATGALRLVFTGGVDLIYRPPTP